MRMSADDQQPEETFGQRIRRLRRSRGLTQRQLAEQLGIDFTYLSKAGERPRRPPW